VGFEHIETQVNVRGFEQIGERQGIYDETQQGIASAAGRIPEGLQGHDPAKRRVKEINQVQKQCSHIPIDRFN
jgi:hypothetical protein